MGFDNECIVNIQSLAGEYFCPVCRLLVYPNEALQSQCTHLYCKSCLTYIVGTTQACPYDGYLVTEADSKPLMESNKALAETIGKIAVHCLYHRSGCQWQGPLSECTSHCSGCTFGNSPVVCNRCGVQIVHRQVQEHAQICPGVQPQVLQVEGVQGAATATSANAEQTQIANQSGVSTSQAQTSQTMAAPPTGQDPNPQANANPQALTVVPAAVPTTEQWYQQQYQQYYQQFPGYDSYQQSYQNYYPYQQQAIQQYQQHPLHVQGQHQPQVFSQPQPQPQPQHNFQSQPQVLPQAQPPPQTQPQAPNQLHSQPQPLQHIQVPVAAQASVNPQHQLHPAVQPPAQMQPQAHPTPHGHPHPQQQPLSQSYGGAQPQPQSHPVQAQSQQHKLMPQYQQPQSQMQHSQQQIQLQPPQVRPQVQTHSQVQQQHQSLPQLQPQTHLQAQSQAQLSHNYPQIPPPPHLIQPPNPNAQPQTQTPPVHAVGGHQSIPKPQAHLQMQLGSQHPPHVHPQSGPTLHPVHMLGQFPQQPPQMLPPQSHAPAPNQQWPVLLPPQGQVPSLPLSQARPIHPHAQQPGHPGHQRPVMQPMQPPVSQKHLQHQQPFPGQTSVPVSNQLHPQGHFVQQQQPMQSQSRPQGPPHSVQQNPLAYMSSEQNVALSHGFQPPQSQNYAAGPMMPNHVSQPQPFTQSSAGFSGSAQVRPMQLGGNQPLTNQNYPLRTNNHLQMSSEQQNVQSGLTLKPTALERQGDHMHEKSVADQKDGSPPQKTAQKEPNGLVPTSGLGADSVGVENIKSETYVKSMDHVQKLPGGDEDNKSQVDMHGKNTGSDLHAEGNSCAEPAVKPMVKKEGNESRLESSPGGKSVEIVSAEHKDAIDIPQPVKHSTANDTSLQRAEPFKEHSGKISKDAAGMLASGGADSGSQAFPFPDSSTQPLTPLTVRDHLQHGSRERNLSQSYSTPQGPGVDEFRSFPSHGQALGKGLMQPSHPFPPTDQGRHQHMPMHYGLSFHQQRSAGDAMLQSALHPGPPHHAQVPGQPPNVLRPQGPGHLPQPGQQLNPPDHFQPPVLKQHHGSFHPEITSGRIPGPVSTLFEKGPSHFGPLDRSFEPQSVVPQEHYNQGLVPPPHAGLPRMSQGEPPGSLNSLGGIMGRAPPHGPEGKIGPPGPINPFRTDMSHHLDGRQPYSHLLGSSERASSGQSPGIESNVNRMNEAAGTDSSSTGGLRKERFNHLTEEGLNRFPMESTRRVDQGEFEKDLRPFPRHPHLDNASTGPTGKFGSYNSSLRLNDRGPRGFSVDAASRPFDKAPHVLNYDAGWKLDPGACGAPRVLPAYHPGGSNDSVDRARPVGPDCNIGSADSIRTHPDFLGPVPVFGRHNMDQLPPRSPGREYPGFPTRDFGDLSGFPHNMSGTDDIEGRGSHPFGEGPRSFNFPSDLVGNSFHESRFPLLPGHLRSGELDGPGNVRSNDWIGQGVPPSHLRRGEFLGPRNLPGHLHFGEPAGFGSFPGHARMGDLAGMGNFPHHLPLGEPFGGNKSGHPRLGEPGFRSSYSITGGMDPFGNSRKRKPASMGWCRICKVDCETVEGLDLHSQTREHQKMAMDMVLSIKQQNAKKKTSNDHSSLEEPSKLRGSGYGIRGNKT